MDLLLPECFIQLLAFPVRRRSCDYRIAEFIPEELQLCQILSDDQYRIIWMGLDYALRSLDLRRVLRCDPVL